MWSSIGGAESSETCRHRCVSKRRIENGNEYMMPRACQSSGPQRSLPARRAPTRAVSQCLTGNAYKVLLPPGTKKMPLFLSAMWNY
eukprot:4170833-Prymnesium_polylepis.2